MFLKEYLIKVVVPHRRGIMGTVIFHLLLAIFLLSMEISRMNAHTEMEIVMETPAPEEVQKKVEEEQRKKEIRQQSAAEEVERMLRSIAVNENTKPQQKERATDVQRYVDEIRKELEAEGEDGRYRAKRDKNYKQDSLQRVRDRREQELDSLKSVFYSGKSSVSYNLKDRYARFLPIPVFKCEFGGKVVVEITVNQRGVVQKATVVEAQSEADDCLWRVAVDAAERSRFNEKPGAPILQKGTITYHFVKQ
ncbi:MAG: energy transducer TonB [Odoribacter sp.]